MDEHYFYSRSRAAAGRACVGIADCNSQEEAAALIRGAAAGFVIGCAEVEGWDAILRHINEIAVAARTPAEPTKPMLRLVS